VIKIEIDELFGGRKRIRIKNQIWFLNHIWFKLGEAGKKEVEKMGRSEGGKKTRGGMGRFFDLGVGILDCRMRER